MIKKECIGNWLTNHRRLRKRGMMRVTCYIFVLLLFEALNLCHAQAIDQNTRAEADLFLKRLTAAEHQGMGGSFVSSTVGANALNSNPAGLSSVDSNRFVVHATRFPQTIAVISRQNNLERYEDHSQYNQAVSGIEFINYVTGLGNLGIIGFDFALQHGGKFSRVDDSGKAVNSFPQTNFAIGVGYGKVLWSGLSFGVDAKWIRSKVRDLDDEEHIGHGYAYNLGLTQQMGKNLRIGFVARNLSNGLSFFDNSIPDRIAHDILFGATYQYQYKNVDLRVGLDFNPPFKDGIRTNIGGEVWYRGFIGGRIGYLRHTENRFAAVHIFQTGVNEIQERLWKAEGLTLGLGVNVGRMGFNAAYTPQTKPVENENELIRIDQGESVYSFSIGQSF